MKRLARILVILLAVGIIAVAGGFVYLFTLDGLESIINHRLSSLVDEQYNLEVHVGNIAGDILSGTVLENVTIHYVDSTHRYLLADIPRITTAYAFSNLWRRNFLLEYLFVDSAVITVVRDSVDGWLVPRFPRRSDSSRTTTPLSFTVEMLGLSDVTVRVIEGADTLGIEDINLVLALQSTDGTYGISVERLEFASADNRLRLDAAGGKMTYDKGRLLLKDLLLHADDTHLRLSGSVTTTEPWSAAVSFDLDNLDLAEVATFIGPRLKGVVDLSGRVLLQNEKLSGSVDIGGRFMIASFENLHVDFRFFNKHLFLDSLYGTILGSCGVDGSGEIDFSTKPERYQLSADLRGFDLKELIANSFHSDLNGRIDLRGESFRKSTLALNIGTELYDSEFHGYHFHDATGELVITTDSLVFVDPFRIDYYENSFLITGCVEYKAETDLTVTADLYNLDRYRGKLFVDRPAGRGRAEALVCGRTSDPDLRGHFESDSLWLYGFFSRDFSAEFDLARFLTGREGFVQVSCFDGNAYGIPYDTCYSYLTVDSDKVSIDTAHLQNEYSSIVTHGLLDYGAYPMQLDFDSLALEVFDVDFYNRMPLLIEIDSAGFEFRQAAIVDNGAMIAVRGRANFDESLDLTILADKVPADPWIDLFDEELPFGGRLSCDIGVQGDLNQPILEVRTSIDSLVYRNLVLGNLVVGAHYRDQRLNIDSLIVLSDPGEYRADGYLHVDLAFTSDAIERFPDRPMDIHITANDRRFDLVSLVLPSVEQLDGDFAADFTLSGTPNAPNLEGDSHISRARLKYFDLEDPFYTDSVGVTMHNNRISIAQAQVYSPDPEHPVFFNGEIIVKSLDNLYYDIDVTIPDPLSVSYELEDIKAKARAKLHIGGDSPPLVTGDIELVSMKYLVNFAEPHEGSPIMAALTMENSWNLDLNIDIPSNYWIKNDDIDAELAGQLNLIRKDGVIRFIGEMEILRGRGFLFDKTFKLEPGGRVFFEGNEVPNPQLDIIGHTRVAAVGQSPLDEQEVTREQIEVCIHVTGTLDVPDINVCGGSQLTREEIVPLLVANYYTSDSLTATGRLEQSISGIVGSRISQIGSRRLNKLGVETFEIDPYYEGEFDPLKARVTVGFYTAQNLYVYGRSALSFESLQELGVEYRFNKNFLLEGRFDEEELYRLSFKAHWEF